MTGWYRRGNLPPVTQTGIDVLLRLREAKQDGWPFIHLPDVHWHTTNALERKGWIFSSDGLDGTRYKITDAGLKALKVYERPARKFDGLCPTCRLRPRYQRKNGRLDPYCAECSNESNRRRYHLGRTRLKPDGVCARCKVSQRHTSRTGRTYSHCKTCLAAIKREWVARKKAGIQVEEKAQ